MDSLCRGSFQAPLTTACCLETSVRLGRALVQRTYLPRKGQVSSAHLLIRRRPKLRCHVSLDSNRTITTAKLQPAPASLDDISNPHEPQPQLPAGRQAVCGEWAERVRKCPATVVAGQLGRRMCDVFSMSVHEPWDDRAGPSSRQPHVHVCMWPSLADDITHGLAFVFLRPRS